MCEHQIISKLIVNQDLELWKSFDWDEKYFTSYLEAFKFIKKHYDLYNKLPDIHTFYDNIEVTNELEDIQEDNGYLVSEITKEYKLRCINKYINEISQMSTTDPDSALIYAQSNLQQISSIGAKEPINIIKQAGDRLQRYKEKLNNKNNYFIPTGFDEIDNINGGWSRDGEFAVIFGRTNAGKTQLLMQFIQHSFKMEVPSLIIEPEMNAIQIGYRFDTAYNHISSSGLFKGNELEQDYDKYISELTKKETPIYYKTLKDYNYWVTPNKLKQDIIKYKIGILYIDGIAFLQPDIYNKYNQRRQNLEFISQQLFNVSSELSCPIICVCQANRNGIKENKGEPELEDIAESDAIAQNATVVLSITNNNQNEFVIAFKKNRYLKNLAKFVYNWDADKGIFISKGNCANVSNTKYNEKGDIF